MTDFVTVTDSPYRSEQTDPQSILVLLTNDLVAIDCKSTGLPSFENPYAMDLQVRFTYMYQDNICKFKFSNKDTLNNIIETMKAYGNFVI